MKKTVDLWERKREFLEYCELDKGQSSLTISGYDRYLNRFLDWLKIYQIEKQKNAYCAENQKENIEIQLLPELIDQETARQYRLFINRLKDNKGRELKPVTQNYHMLSLRAFLRYLRFRGINTLSPENIQIAKTGDREITFMNGGELEQILCSPDPETPQGLRDKTILSVLFSTGLRVSELVSLNIKSLNLQTGEISVMGKGRKLRLVFLSVETIEIVRQYLAFRGYLKPEDASPEEPLFVSPKETRLSVRTVERIVQKYARKAGLNKKVSPHTFRHSFATDLLSAGADVRSVQTLLGHSSITTTQIYTHVTDQHLREIHQAFHGKTLEKENEKPAST